MEMKTITTKEITGKKIKISEHVSIDMPLKTLHFSLFSWATVIPLH